MIIVLKHNSSDIIAYGSRALIPTGSKYSPIEREALSVLFIVLFIYLAGCQFKIITGHKPLLCVWKKINSPLRIYRWSLRLLPYKLVLKYQKGQDNRADYLSRHPCKNTEYCP